MQSNVFCGGLFCRKSDRKKCLKCDKYVCNGCSFSLGKRYYCIDCGLEEYLKRNINIGAKKLIKMIEK